MDKMIMNKRRMQAGFTVGEMVIVIAIVAILAGLIAPLAVNVITQSRMNAAIEELDNIKKAIVGDPTLVQGGSRTSFGFVGDMGILPRANLGDLGLGVNGTLGDLLFQNGLPLTQTDLAGTEPSRVMWGWRGAYISDTIDPWGREYNYLIRLISNDNNRLAVIWSAGPDGQTDADPFSGAAINADNPTISIRYDEAFSIITGNTLDLYGAGTDYTVTIFAPNGNGLVQYSATPATTTSQIPIYTIYNVPAANGNGIPTGIPIGIRTIRFRKPPLGNYSDFFLSINNGPITTYNFRESGP